MTTQRFACPLAAAAKTSPDAPVLLSHEGTISYREFEALVDRNALQLLTRGLRTGDVVGLAAPPSLATLGWFMGIVRAGGVVCPVDPWFPDDYRRDLLSSVSPALVLGNTPPLFTVIDAAETPSLPQLSAARPATLVFTSGSTGKPKAALHSLANHLHSAQRANANMPLAPGDGWLLSLGIHHAAGIGILFRCWTAGAAVVLPEDAPLAEAIHDTRVTHLSLVPAQLARILEDEAAAERLRTMKAVLLGGAAVPSELLRRAHNAGLPIHTSYGMTETASQITATRPGDPLEKLLTSGRPLGPGAVCLAEEDEITVGGPTLFLGYLQNGRLTKPFTPDGWFPTGDLGSIDEDGYLAVTGRRDNMFLAGGENVQPEEVEAALCALPGVAEAVVVPVPHPDYGASPAAFVRMADGSMPNGTVLRAALLEQLPKFKVARHWLPWPEDLAQGIKLNRRQLAERAERAIRGA
ncbi:MAG: o-succinylbenzoate--CoA ligase [Candidatus Hydrogenedentota bacterium]